MPLNPPRDDGGNIKAHDDSLIEGKSSLIRHINIQEHVYFDENLQRKRIKSAAFSRTSGDPDNGMSVDIGQLLLEQQLPENSRVPAGMAAVKFIVSEVRGLALRVGSDPLEENDCHGQVWDVKDTKRKKLQAIVSDWVISIPDVALR